MVSEQKVFIVDDDQGVREGLSLLLETIGQSNELFSSALEFLDVYSQDMAGCLIVDIRMPRMTGLDLQKKLNEKKSMLPIIFITGHGDIPMAVEAMRCGAIDFIRKPFREQELLDRINEALDINSGVRQQVSTQQNLIDKVESLTDREREVFQHVATGDMNKVIGYDLGISERTVEVHRSQVMKKLEVKTLAQLVRIKMEWDMLDNIES